MSDPLEPIPGAYPSEGEEPPVSLKKILQENPFLVKMLVFFFLMLFVPLALANGADATFVCGCAIGDCHYRTGNLMIRERLEGKRNPKLRKTTDRKKVGMFFVTMKDRITFMEALAEFKAGLEPKPVVED